MPRYDFSCPTCGKVSETTTLTPPVCCDKPMRRVWQAPAMRWRIGRERTVSRYTT